MRLINGKPALEIMVERVKKAKLANKIIIATTTNFEDDVIVDYVKKITLIILEEVKTMFMIES